MSAPGSRLSALTKQLAADWEQTKDAWRDAKAQEFEQRFLLELFSSAERAVTVIEQLDKVIGNVKRDCE